MKLHVIVITLIIAATLGLGAYTVYKDRSGTNAAPVQPQER